MKLPITSFIGVFFGFSGWINPKALINPVDTMNQVSFNFFKVALKNEPGNFVYSPLGVLQLLSTGLFGSSGKTRTELDDSLQMQNFLDYIQTNTSNFIVKNNETVLDIYNMMFFNEKIQLESKYKKATADDFESTIDDADDYKRLSLLNTYIFKSGWRIGSPPKFTSMKPFYLNNTCQVNVPTMKLQYKYNLKYIHDLDATIIKLPYKMPDHQDSLAMFIIVPNKIQGLKLIEDNIDRINLKNFDNESTRELIDLFLPKFKLDTYVDVKEHLKKMGIRRSFTRAAEFSDVYEHPKFFVDQVVQNITVDVHEHGTGHHQRAGTYRVVNVNMTSKPDVKISSLIFPSADEQNDEGLPYAMTTTTDESEIDELPMSNLVESFNEMSLIFFKIVLENEPGNFVFSPFGVSQLITMLVFGALDITRLELQNFVKMLNFNYYITYDTFNNIPQLESNLLRIKNKVYIDKKFYLNSTFMEIISDNFESPVEQLDFKKSIAARNTINREIKKNGIYNVLKTGDVEKNDNLFLLNIIHLETGWELGRQKKKTLLKPFYINYGRTVKVPTMERELNILYTNHKVLNAKIIQIFHRMGINQAFTTDANFTGISQMKNLFINKIIQKSIIEVNEKNNVETPFNFVNINTTSKPDVKIPPLFLPSTVKETNREVLFTIIGETDKSKIYGLPMSDFSLKSFNEMSINFFKIVLKNEPGNFVFSPFGVSQLLTMSYFGARNKTRSELVDFLHEENLKNYINTFINIKIGEKRIKNVLSVQNKIYVDKKIKLKSAFKEITSKIFKSTVEQLNFENTEETKNTINSEIRKNGISNILKTGDVENNDNLFLLNAINLEAGWELGYQTKPILSKQFYISDGHSVEVPTMERNLNVFRTNNKALNATIVKIFHRMGINQAFTTDANFTGISQMKNLFINKIIQKSTIEVNEKNNINTPSYYNHTDGIDIKVDRSFLVVIAIRKFIIFTGRVSNPLL
ncbi:hypothetical protein HCN44_001503 [Aphidius gifuensis]|uniref:Serpin domain-containing protein n=1 Tax=Aphidius gifuensis TaxID=684658 RepID=A0A835CSE1_APHGI|nr:hypothetical protein HCN44_001503 [Aphidius gifuensis]